MEQFNVAINGTGRIGLCACRLLGKNKNIKLVAINSTTPIDTLVHLLKYDTVHRFFDAEKVNEDTIRIGEQIVKVVSDRDPLKIPFGQLGAEIVLECTGAFNSKEKATAHLREGVKKVIISAPADNTPTFVYGVNHQTYNGEQVISNASCTTNALAPLVKILHIHYGIQSGLMTTVHSYTNDQNLLDVKHKDVRRARAAALNIIPTSTGAAKAIGLVIPELSGLLNGFSVRVPTPDVSLVDLNVQLKKHTSKEEINDLMRQMSQVEFANLVAVDEERCVSSDFIGSTYSSIFIPDCTQVVDKNHAKVIAWYDNEMGYTARLIDMATFVATR
ncbi:type I glyceraldehyde-3-phosphate dehydrogenase [Helicobacter monodelphidis]|uniref:type I glyceraldehyde-3-phosphate dehydrogenase n=1 Tax=Helicobacter sp. 15-1451 TaxID=2004995 RepID=UPI000DCF28F0|nr:type I glyceraldehyde-3-phosphate dehydrogenase [Helicobacter sp. 15-1451]RAX58160.1 type I glyceraldehyde-3-phosphate dehydrogenase [Helicobacter sp. 15-1451]